MDSLYDIDGYQDYAKPSDSMGENDYTQDVFFETRPELFKRDENPEPEEVNPFFQYRNEQNDVTDKEFSDFKNTNNPKQWDAQLPNLVDPLTYKKIKDVRSYKIAEIVSNYRLENEPIVLGFTKLIEDPDKGFSFFELVKETSAFSKANAPKCTVGMIRQDPNKRTWSFLVRGHKKDSNPRGHVVTVKLGTDPEEKNIQKLRVHVSCSCPFWKYWGPDYNADTLEYLDGDAKSNGKSPDIRDPGRRNKICKHVYAVGQIFDRFAKKHDLDTQKEVSDILKSLDKTIDPLKMDDITALKDTLLLNRSEIKELDPFIKKYNKEEDPKKRDKIKEQTLKKIEDILSNKDRGILKTIQKGLKSLFTKIKEKIFRKKSSVDNVLEIYLAETGDL